MGQFFLLLEWTIVAAILVLLVVNGDKTANIITSFFSGWVNETTVLTGTGYKLAK